MDGYLWDVGERGKHEIKSLKEPATRETVVLLRESVRINHGTPDEKFTLEFPANAKVIDRRAPQPSTGEAVAEIPVGARGVPKVTADALLAAERQRLELEATSRAREAWSWGSLTSYAFGIVGGAAMIVAIVFWFIRRV